MNQLIGFKRNVSLDIREKFAIRQSKTEQYLCELTKRFSEVVIINTCNRIEIYFNADNCSKANIDFIFDIFNWDKDLKEYIFHDKDDKVTEHLMEVACGFHSKILGEDQILGQVKDSFLYSKDRGAASNELGRLFQTAITCGKQFRTEAKLYEIPVSSSSIAVHEAIDRGHKTYMVIGYGEIGSLAVKYLLGQDVGKIFLVVRTPENVKDIFDPRVEVINFNRKNEVLNEVECIISCTSAPHPVVRYEEIPKKVDLFILDLAVPRDVDKEIRDLDNVELLDIDDISRIDDKNKALRRARMIDFKYIIKEYFTEYSNWLKMRELSPVISAMKEAGKEVVSDRYASYRNRANARNSGELAEVLIKSTSDHYINKAINVLKEAKLKGCEDQCMEIISRIFLS
ncbi:glutamyl-tRNA reductase [Clostridium fungisolvens]|uniref:Glutamyl-tRNA reductase n=1 Tax=Clostridium fungisolvens TaxID=1604897 RepID=A0A6V8SCG8_9CLOT|nr:glutamyl-tRNA reductase [Clostridium fungisolvens]GFP74939.1 Glutamyl-tRNA reductase [Clostridium fungisolvens]